MKEPVKGKSEAGRRREARAQQTRQRIVDASSHLFVDHGYAATTVELIAKEAGVAAATVYQAFGTKHAILARVLATAVAGDAEPVPLLDQAWVNRARREPDGVRRLTIVARAAAPGAARTATIKEVMRDAAGTEPEVQKLIREDHERRYRTGICDLRSENIRGSIRETSLAVDEVCVDAACVHRPLWPNFKDRTSSSVAPTSGTVIGYVGIDGVGTGTESVSVRSLAGSLDPLLFRLELLTLGPGGEFFSRGLLSVCFKAPSARLVAVFLRLAPPLFGRECGATPHDDDSTRHNRDGNDNNHNDHDSSHVHETYTTSELTMVNSASRADRTGERSGGENAIVRHERRCGSSSARNISRRLMHDAIGGGSAPRLRVVACRDHRWSPSFVGRPAPRPHVAELARSSRTGRRMFSFVITNGRHRPTHLVPHHHPVHLRHHRHRPQPPPKRTIDPAGRLELQGRWMTTLGISAIGARRALGCYPSRVPHIHAGVAPQSALERQPGHGRSVKKVELPRSVVGVRRETTSYRSI